MAKRKWEHCPYCLQRKVQKDVKLVTIKRPIIKVKPHSPHPLGSSPGDLHNKHTVVKQKVPVGLLFSKGKPDTKVAIEKPQYSQLYCDVCPVCGTVVRLYIKPKRKENKNDF